MTTHTTPAAWAPTCLVEKRAKLTEQLLRQIDGHREYTLRGEPSDEERAALARLFRGKFDSGSSETMRSRISRTERFIEMLDRLLSREDMRVAWAAVERSPVKRRSIVDLSVPCRYWLEIEQAVIDFEAAPKQTTMEKRDSLGKIADQARALVNSISGNPYATEIEKLVPRSSASLDHMRLRTGDHSDWPSSPFFEDFLSTDAIEARQLSRDAMSAPQWEKLPPEQRFAFWTRALHSTGLSELLEQFAKWVDQEASIATEIKQPGRGDQAMVAFMIRRLSRLAVDLHGTPLDEAVGIVVTAALDHPIPLGRDDVRAYRRDRGVKLTVVK